MLEPREADIPAVFLVLVVLPLVAYILLGKWSEAAKKKESITLLAQLAAEEAFRAEAMATANIIPLAPSLNNDFHQCARCFGPATTRCSRCKSVRYCSGNCQIIHWRQLHKKACQQLENTSSFSSPSPIEESIHGSVLGSGIMHSQFFVYNSKHPVMENRPSDNMDYPATSSEVDPSTFPDRRTTEKRVSRKPNRVMSMRDEAVICSEDASGSWINNSTSSSTIASNEAYVRHKLRNNNSVGLEEDISTQNFCSSSNEYIRGYATSKSKMQGTHDYQAQYGNSFERRRNGGSSLRSAVNGVDLDETGVNFIPDGGNSHTGIPFNDETLELNPSENTTMVSLKDKSTSRPRGSNKPNSPKASRTASGEQLSLELEAGRARDTIPKEGSHGAESVGIMKTMGLKKSTKLSKYDTADVIKIKMLFPYEEFVKYFHCEVFNLSPRGLINCGNSCYANAVLQCLTCTKPLIIYLLHRSHSRACCSKEWCLMCELEQHVMMLRENGGPLSPGRILLHMQSTNCQIGDGSQEDAHEFLRIIVASMQSICLEGLGGEKKADSRWQETTFVQHTFGGRLRSKVKCLSCHHDSERYENIMDLTLEIYGWVESLEDALTQFTTPEDLDGENMYRCGRCATYVRARKQLKIHEAPNILTIVLKRFQEGKYGKINKCITFPEMLDMIPFMTGADDIPPLYMLYAVVVHHDMLNASFSGHYVSYVKDLQGNWFRINDTEVQPVHMSQVMSEGAYILFYMRSYPRPQKVFTDKAIRQQAPASTRHYVSKSSKTGHRKSTCNLATPEPLQVHGAEPSLGFTNLSSNGIRNGNKNMPSVMETYAESVSKEFSDATSSDWSLFTSSDDASFTTESTSSDDASYRLW